MGHRHHHSTLVAAERHGHAGLNETRLAWAAGLTGAFMLAEVTAGLIANSLALLADAGHMLTDFAALGMAWYGSRMANRPPDTRRTYGFDRVSVLVAFVNGIALFVMAAWICVEAAGRFAEPVEVLPGPMLAVAILGLCVNLGVFLILHKGSGENLNVRAATLHVMGDLLGSVAAICAAVAIMATGWSPIDPILSVLVAVIILRSAWVIVGESGHILLEGAPRGKDAEEIARDLTRAIPELEGAYHLHIWSISEDRPMITLNAELAHGANGETVLIAIKERLATAHGLEHSTVEITFATTNGGAG